MRVGDGLSCMRAVEWSKATSQITRFLGSPTIKSDFETDRELLLEEGFCLDDAKPTSKLRGKTEPFKQADGNITGAVGLIDMKHP